MREGDKEIMGDREINTIPRMVAGGIQLNPFEFFIPLSPYPPYLLLKRMCA
jgi:hypothetical protein